MLIAQSSSNLPAKIMLFVFGYILDILLFFDCNIIIFILHYGYLHALYLLSTGGAI